jgi:hypothetical protein
MKRVSILFFISCIATFSCTKTSDVINKKGLAGTWLLTQYDGGYSYQIIVPTDKITVTFDSESKFNSSANFTIPASGNYTITKDSDRNHYSDTVIKLIGDDQNRITYGIKLTKDSLFLFDGCCDGFRYSYVRIK